LPNTGKVRVSISTIAQKIHTYVFLEYLANARLGLDPRDPMVRLKKGTFKWQGCGRQTTTQLHCAL
jgi:hypothetical protein